MEPLPRQTPPSTQLEVTLGAILLRLALRQLAEVDTALLALPQELFTFLEEHQEELILTMSSNTMPLIAPLFQTAMTTTTALLIDALLDLVTTAISHQALTALTVTSAMVPLILVMQMEFVFMEEIHVQEKQFATATATRPSGTAWLQLALHAMMDCSALP